MGAKMPDAEAMSSEALDFRILQHLRESTKNTGDTSDEIARALGVARSKVVGRMGSLIRRGLVSDHTDHYPIRQYRITNGGVMHGR